MAQGILGLCGLTQPSQELAPCLGWLCSWPGELAVEKWSMYLQCSLASVPRKTTWLSVHLDSVITSWEDRA